MEQSQLLRDITPYVYGTTRLGDEAIPEEERITVARAAMNAGLWFHTSRQYNDALEILGKAFTRDPSRVPPLIVKLIGDTSEELRQQIDVNIGPLGVDHIELGQLCLGEELAKEFAIGGPCYKEFEKLKSEGLVSRFVLEVFPWTSDAPLHALKAGYPEGIIDGYIFYLNPLQRFAANELWDVLMERKQPIIAMRTVSGGNVHRLRDVPGAAWKDYLQKRAVEVAPIFERSGIESWTEFCVRFAHSFPNVRATVGSSSKVEHLNAFLAAASTTTPLPQDIVDKIVRLQYRWSDETDIHAEPWSM
ncbi:MAG TPA: hypothetical protein ENN69_01605 [Spirochaetia bacterium]|nr:hypothetical protein [Spirochaetia bacterium]